MGDGRGWSVSISLHHSLTHQHLYWNDLLMMMMVVMIVNTGKEERKGGGWWAVLIFTSSFSRSLTSVGTCFGAADESDWWWEKRKRKGRSRKGKGEEREMVCE